MTTANIPRNDVIMTTAEIYGNSAQISHATRTGFYMTSCLVISAVVNHSPWKEEAGSLNLNGSSRSHPHKLHPAIKFPGDEEEADLVRAREFGGIRFSF